MLPRLKLLIDQSQQYVWVIKRKRKVGKNDIPNLILKSKYTTEI